jgi:hypothetical protein
LRKGDGEKSLMGEESLPIHDTIIGSIILSVWPLANTGNGAQVLLKKKKKKQKKERGGKRTKKAKVAKYYKKKKKTEGKKKEDPELLMLIPVSTFFSFTSGRWRMLIG